MKFTLHTIEKMSKKKGEKKQKEPKKILDKGLRDKDKG
jgi:hypothetical protein